MIGFAETFGATLGSFLLPAFIALLIVLAAARYVRPMYLAAFAIGLYLWFFSDTIGDASLLGVSEGFTGGVWHAALWICFAIGLLLIVSLDKSTFAEGSAGERLGFAIPVLVAIAVGLHGFGEGAAIGATAATTPSTNLLDAFGGLSTAGAFILHKGLEPMMVGAAYWVYAKDHARDMNGRLKDLLILTLAFALPGIIGGASAYYIVQVYPSADFTYVFALGLGTSIYAAVRLARPLFQASGSGSESIKIALSMILGFTCLYLAALLHS
jgi:zinc transporter ZupT